VLDVPFQKPYWSLAFEVWFYAIFAVAFFGRGPLRYVGTGLLCLLLGPRIVAMMPIWLIGVGAYYLHRHWRPAVVTGVPLAMLGLCAYVALKATLAREPGFDTYAINGMWLATPLWTHFQIHMDYAVLFTLDWMLGAAFGILLIAAPVFADRLPTGGSVSAAIKYLAGMTFSLYLFQSPLMHMTAPLSPKPGAPWTDYFCYILFLLLLVAAVAYFTERQKPKLHQWMELGLDHIVDRLPNWNFGAAKT
jgi:peptidoglycan/LPS O-acetylase OafA/YrhL